MGKSSMQASSLRLAGSGGWEGQSAGGKAMAYADG